MSSFATQSTRDPVCEAIESLLRELESQGQGKLQVTRLESSVRVTFGEFQIDAPTQDIAVVRLASAMMDSPKFSQSIMEALRQPRALARAL